MSDEGFPYTELLKAVPSLPVPPAHDPSLDLLNVSVVVGRGDVVGGEDAAKTNTHQFARANKSPPK